MHYHERVSTMVMAWVCIGVAVLLTIMFGGKNEGSVGCLTLAAIGLICTALWLVLDVVMR
jgi:hypothetical protein